jgi:hypothetical protein
MVVEYYLVFLDKYIYEAGINVILKKSNGNTGAGKVLGSVNIRKTFKIKAREPSL